MLASRGRGPGSSETLHGALDLVADAPSAYRLICEVEKWPVWLSFLRSARRLDDGPLRVGSEVAIRSAIPGEEEELFEVDRLLENHCISLVGAFSVRRRFDFRLENRADRTKLVVRVDYPTYGGAVGVLLDRLTARRRIGLALEDSLVHFKGLAEFKHADGELLTDF